MHGKQKQRIGIMSDSHDNRAAVKEAVSFFNGASCGLVLHAGDIIAPFTAEELSRCSCPVKAVFGNCDGEKQGLRRKFAGWGEILEPPLDFEWTGLRFRLVHTDDRVDEFVNSKKFDVVVFGHTHKPEIRKEQGCLAVNPGECGGWLTGKKTVSLLDAESRSAEIISLD